MTRSVRHVRGLFACLAFLLAARAAVAAPLEPCVPVAGFIEAKYAALDEVMLELICAEEISGAVMGVMVGGRIVAHRGYGWLDEQRSRTMRPDALMRIASITKPIVAAAVRDLIEEGLLSLDDRAFDVGQEGGGLLALEPFPSLGDERLKDVTIAHLLLHTGGWDRSEVGDLTYQEVTIARAMDVPSPPGRENTIRYILGRPLQFDPGSKRAYSNIGSLVLGLIVERITGKDLVDVIHERVLGPLGVTRTELVLGRTFREEQCEREPPYDDADLVVNVFDPEGERVRRPYGGWHHEARVGQGGLVTTTETLLKVLENRHINGPQIGARRDGGERPNWRQNHSGSLRGLNGIAVQRGDGVNYVLIVNKRAAGNPAYANRIRERFDETLDAMTAGE